MRELRTDVIAGELLDHVAIEAENDTLAVELAGVGVPLAEVARVVVRGLPRYAGPQVPTLKTAGPSAIDRLFDKLRAACRGNDRAPRSSLTEGLYRCVEVIGCLPDQVGLNPRIRKGER